MSRLFRSTSRVSMAVFGLLLIGGAIAYAQHNAKLARMLAAPARAVAVVAEHSFVQGTTSSRPLVKLFLTGAIERDSKKIPVEKAGPVTPGEVINFTMNSVNEGSASARDYRAVGQIREAPSLLPAAQWATAILKSAIQSTTANSFRRLQ